jgi:hypothetical protein
MIYMEFLQRIQGERNCQGERNHEGDLHLAIDVKGGEKEKKHEDRGSMSVSINVKGGYCWKIGFH